MDRKDRESVKEARGETKENYALKKKKISSVDNQEIRT
jgi:hypothetical protein